MLEDKPRHIVIPVPMTPIYTYEITEEQLDRLRYGVPIPLLGQLTFAFVSLAIGGVLSALCAGKDGGWTLHVACTLSIVFFIASGILAYLWWLAHVRGRKFFDELIQNKLALLRADAGEKDPSDPNRNFGELSGRSDKKA